MLMRAKTPWNVLAWLCAAAAATWLVVASAQTPESPQWPNKQASTAQKASPPTDAELKSFAGAVVEVHRINDAYIPKL